MFDDPISIFKNFTSKPETISLGSWLKACIRGTNEQKELQVQQYRETGNQQIKKSLPLATVGAVCEGGRKLEDVQTRTGWIALDVDAKDNPHIKDAARLRDELAKFRFVAFAGLSVSAKGVWALIKVRHPEKQAEYFQQLIKDFESRGIILDSTKGKNPNDARFYSYDPDAYITSDFAIYDRLPKATGSGKVPVVKTFKSSNFEPLNTDAYGQAAFSDEINILSRTQQGNRNHQLFKSTASLASLVAGGVLNRQEVQRTLFDTALSIGLKEPEIKRTIQSGFDAGMKQPRTPEPNTRYSARVNHATTRDKPLQAKYESRSEANMPKNGKTGVNLNSKGYPASWDDPDIQAAWQLEQLKQRDPVVKQLVELFDGEVVPASAMTNQGH